MSREASNIEYLEPINVVKSGKRGRPRKSVNVQLLREAMRPERNISISGLSRVLGVHRNTLRAKMKENHVTKSFSSISDVDLDAHVQTFRVAHPDSGLRYLIGYLRAKGLRVAWSRVSASLKRVDKIGQTLRGRKNQKVKRKQYHVSRPDALWHIDGHHKLISWGFVIHGIVDGYSRAVGVYQ